MRSNIYNKKHRLVSEVIPICNQGKYIFDTLDGLKKQTYK